MSEHDTSKRPRRAKGEGGIRQLSDGRYMATIELGYENGKRLRKSFIHRKQEIVAKKLRQALASQDKGEAVTIDERITVAAYVDRWFATSSVKSKTRRSYAHVLTDYVKPMIGSIRLARLDPDHVRKMCRELETIGRFPTARERAKNPEAPRVPVSRRSATMARDVLRIALSQAVRDGRLARNVAKLAKRPKGDRAAGADRTALTLEESRALLAGVAGDRLEGLITIGVGLGLRLGEALGLQWADVDFERRTVSIRNAVQTDGKRRILETLKTTKSRRPLPLPSLIARALRRERRKQAERQIAAGEAWRTRKDDAVGDFVFTTRTGRPHDGTLITRDLKRRLERTWIGGREDCAHTRAREEVIATPSDALEAGARQARRVCLECGARGLPVVSFHALRHSCATILIASGTPAREVSEHLGHSSVELTLSTYAHVQTRAHMGGLIDGIFGTAGAADEEGLA